MIRVSSTLLVAIGYKTVEIMLLNGGPYYWEIYHARTQKAGL